MWLFNLSENYLAVLFKSQLCKATIVEIFLPVSIFTALGAKSAHFLTWSQKFSVCAASVCNAKAKLSNLILYHCYLSFQLYLFMTQVSDNCNGFVESRENHSL